MEQDKLLKNLERLLAHGMIEQLLINGQFKCGFGNRDDLPLRFSTWMKDISSPSEFCISEQMSVVDVNDNAKQFIGALQMQRSPDLHSKEMFASLCLRDMHSSSSMWDRIVTVTSIDI